MRRSILLFARSPEREASAKRMRLAAPLFRALVASWLDAAKRHDATPVIACDDGDREALASIAPEIAREWIEQRGNSFGERVARAADETFARGFDAVLIAAIDAPPHDLAEAFATLERGTPVLSPSRDGGINYLGLTKPMPELLAQLELHRRNLAALCKRALPFHLLRASIDLDNQSALAMARTDRAWRPLLHPPPTQQPSNPATPSSRDSLPRASRAPPPP